MDTYVLNPISLSVKQDSLKNKFISVGGNPGNMVFINALKEQLFYKKEVDLNYQDGFCEDQVFVMPSSNFIRRAKGDKWPGRAINFMKKNRGKITLVGLGAQASDILDTPRKLVKYGLSKEQVTMFKMFSERCVSLGVRGPFTAECLEEMGIHNYRIIGCPSYFKYLNGCFPIIEKPRQCGNIQMSITPGNKTKTQLFKFGMKYDCKWVLQCKEEIPRIYDGIGGRYRCELKWLLKNFPGLNKSADEIKDYYEKNGFIFWNIEDWNEFYKRENITFAFGTRFHGNMQALRNGVPALWITHDNRTKELTDFLHLPHMEIAQFQRIRCMEELFEICDYTEAAHKYNDLLENYIIFLKENGINSVFDSVTV